MSYIWLILFFFCSFNFADAKTDKLYSDQEIELIKTKMSSKLESNLSSYLGKIKFSVFLKLESKTVNSKQSDSLNRLNSIYLLENQIIKDELSLPDKSIDKASIKVVVYESLNDAINKEIQEIATSTMDGIKTTVKVSYLESTRSIYDQANIESKDLFSFIKSILSKHLSEVMKLIGVLIFAIVAIFGVVIFARLLKGPLNSIAESIKSFSAKHNQAGKPEEDKQKLHQIADHKELSDKFKENLVIFKNILIEKPLEIANLILKNEKNAAGIKKILPYVYEKKYCDKIKECFTGNHFAVIEKSSFNFESNVDFFSWFEEIIEFLSIETLKTRMNVLSAIPEAQLGVIKKIPRQLLKSYLDENSNPITYQIFMDLLEGEEKEEFLKGLDLDEWKIAIEINDISESEIMREIEAIINFASAPLRNADIVSASEIHSSLIIPSLLSVVHFKKLKLQDDFLDSLALVSEDSIKSIREVFWAPRDILRVPQQVLRDHMRAYDINQKAMIVYAMPVDIGDFLLETSMEGKVREIVKDSMIDKKKDFNDEKAEMVGATFISSLFVAYKSNDFKLTEHAKIVNKYNVALTNIDDELANDLDFDIGDEISEEESDEDIDAA